MVLIVKRRMRVVPRVRPGNDRPTRRTSNESESIRYMRYEPNQRLIGESNVTRNLLAVDTKSLDSEAELKRFFGAKVVASAQQGQSTKQSRQQKLFQNYIAKIRTVLVPYPKSTWPIQSGFGGLSMRQLDLEEVLEMMRRRKTGGAVGKLEGERWFTFEHDAGWRQIHTQFLGAVRSHGQLPIARRGKVWDCMLMSWDGRGRSERAAGVVIGV